VSVGGAVQHVRIAGVRVVEFGTKNTTVKISMLTVMLRFNMIASQINTVAMFY